MRSFASQSTRDHEHRPASIRPASILRVSHFAAEYYSIFPKSEFFNKDGVLTPLFDVLCTYEYRLPSVTSMSRIGTSSNI
jgi:hypothetical protein